MHRRRSSEREENTDLSDESQQSGSMSEAVFQLDWTDLETIGWGEIIAHCQDAGPLRIEMLEGDCRDCVCEVEVESPLDDTLLTEVECLNQWELVTESDNTYLYLLELTSADLPESITESHKQLIGTCEPSIGEHGIVLSLLGPQKPIGDVIRNFETVGATPNLRKLGEYSGDRSPLSTLTNRQLEVIETAFDLGYYEVPRQATTEDVAEDIDIDAATVSEHLQRGERNLLRHELTRP